MSRTDLSPTRRSARERPRLWEVDARCPAPTTIARLNLKPRPPTSVARGRTALGSFLKYGVPIGALVVAAWMIYGSVVRAFASADDA